MKFVPVALLACLLFAASAVAEDVWVTYDAQGRPTYSDRPLSSQSRKLDVRSRPTDEEQVAAEAADLEAAEAQRRRRAADEALVAGVQDSEAARRLQQCRDARQRAETYESSQRLYEELPDGGRRYLSDEELERAREEARQAVTRYCTPP
jgi:hypothetical protein